jgi:uncharacterized coiled-coil protein SlyX
MEHCKMSQEENDLATHVNLCHLRYQQLEARLNGMETRLIKVEDQIADIKSEMAQGFAEIKLLLEKQNNSRSTQVIAGIGSIIVALIGLAGYLLTKH